MVDQINLPDKIVTRLMREVLPDDVQVSKEAKNAICHGASIFVLQLTIAAAERAQAGRRRTLQDKDIIKSASTLGLNDYEPQLVRFSAQRKRNAKRKETKVAKARSSKLPIDEPNSPTVSEINQGGEDEADSINDLAAQSLNETQSSQEIEAEISPGPQSEEVKM